MFIYFSTRETKPVWNPTVCAFIEKKLYYDSEKFENGKIYIIQIDTDWNKFHTSS